MPKFSSFLIKTLKKFWSFSEESSSTATIQGKRLITDFSKEELLLHENKVFAEEKKLSRLDNFEREILENFALRTARSKLKSSCKFLNKNF